MGSKLPARVFLVLGFLAAWIGYTSWYTARIAFDPGATRAAAHAILTAPPVQRGLADQMTTQVDRELKAAGAGQKVTDAVHAAIRDPRVANAFADALAQVHQALLVDKGEQITIDTRALTSAVHDALAKQDPDLAKQFAKHGPIAVHLGGKDLPHLGAAHRTVETVSLLAILAALVLIAGSLVLCHERKVFVRVGRRTAMLSLGPLLAFVVVPFVLAHIGGNVAPIASAVLRAYRGRVLPSALVLLVAGLAVMLAAMAARLVVRPAPEATAESEPQAAPPQPLGRFAAPNPLHPSPGEPAITETLYL